MNLKPPEAILGPLSVEIRFFLIPPKSCPKGRHYPSVRPDVDNLAKLILDCLQPDIMHDDCQVVSLLTSKEYSSQPGVLIIIKRMDPLP